MKIQAAAEVSVDVLFAAFEKFITGVWREHMGPIISAPTLTEIQTKCCKLIFIVDNVKANIKRHTTSHRVRGILQDNVWRDGSAESTSICGDNQTAGRVSSFIRWMFSY